MRIDECKAECCDGRPELAAVFNGGGDRSLDAFPDVRETVAGEEGLHAKEVGVEERCEEDLIDYDFGKKGEEFGGVVEVVS